MILQNLELTNFRTYENLKIKFNSGCNIFYGNNAQGKTNIIEAIYCLCFSRSFRTKKEKEFIQFQKMFTKADGQFLSDINIKKNVLFLYNQTEGKSIFIESKKLNRHSELIGQFPIVLLSPEDYKISSEGPIERRRPFDILFSQISPLYLNALQKYNRILKQRNKILFDQSIQLTRKLDTLEPWNQGLVETGSYIIKFRKNFIEEFNPLIQKIYSELNLAHESIHLSYKPSILFETVDEISSSFKEKLDKNFKYENKRGITLWGPHRDDYTFELGGNELRIYGSRGQHKSALLTIKLAEFYFLKEKTQETPIMLLDDLFSDLDQSRKNSILEILPAIGQTFVTTTERVGIKSSKIGSQEFFVQNGFLESQVL